MLDLESSPGHVVQQDVMTSSKHLGDDFSAMEEMLRIKNALAGAGFEVLRQKIESEPSHRLAPQQLGDAMPPNTYFESHVAFLIQESARERLKEIAVRNRAHISRNPFKKTEQGLVVMVTLRDYQSPFCVFQKHVETLLHDASQVGFLPCKKIEVEFAVYDSNIHHDQSWIG